MISIILSCLQKCKRYILLKMTTLWVHTVVILQIVWECDSKPIVSFAGEREREREREICQINDDNKYYK